MPNNYLAFTIGPIYRTITRARKTRELWASSYVFSLLMRHLLQHLPQENVLLPNVSEDYLHASPNGAGIWPDRCIVALPGDNLPDIKAILKQTIKDLANDLGVQPFDLGPMLSIQVLHADWRTTPISKNANGEDADLVPIHRINRLLDNLELKAPYLAKEDQNLNQVLADNVHELYHAAGHTSSKVFIQLSDGSVRLPSLPEIALHELSVQPESKDIYQQIVTRSLNDKIVKLRQTKGRAKDLDGQKDNEQFYLDLTKELPSGTIRQRHKYIAVVVADGDSLGKTISAISKGNSAGLTLSDFSQGLQSFSASAVQKIVDYGGLPIYAGGDDLLFVAPITGEGGNIMQLCADLDKAFGTTISGASLSFGVAINYYKHPLGETVAQAYELEKKAKAFKTCYQEDQPADAGDLVARSAKNALCYQVQKHSGQQFGATLQLHQASSATFLDLLKAHPEDDQAFLTSVMHKLQALPTLIAEAAKAGRQEDFRKHHFNEGGKHDKDYLKKVMGLAQEIFRQYGDLLPQETNEDLAKDSRFANKTTAELLDIHHTNLLFATLRLKQFLIQADHE